MDEVKIPKPQKVALEISHQCRFHCRYCQGRLQSPGNNELTTSQYKKILVALADYSPACTVVFTGGEPMERKDLFDLLKYANHIGLQTILATCGYLIDESQAVALKEAKVTCLSLSLDGASAETHDRIRQSPGGFNAVMNAAKLASANDLPFEVSTTLNRLNQAEVIAIAALAQQLGATSFNPFILVPRESGEDSSGQVLDAVEYETLLNELLSIKMSHNIPMQVVCGPQFERVKRSRAEERLGASSGCLGGRSFGYITRQGDVQTCGFLQIKAGNLLDNNFDFAKIWEESQHLCQVRDLSQREGKCSLCEYLEFCGGCRARAFTSTGNVTSHDPFCEK